LVELVRDIVSRFPNQGAAAKALTIHRTRITQILGGNVGASIERGFFAAIGLALDGDAARLRKLSQAIITVEGRKASKSYFDWVNSHFDYQESASPSGRPPLKEPVRRVYRIIRRDPKYRSYINSFFAKLRGRGWDQSRAEVAIFRALEPLMVGSQTGGNGTHA
jgi:hypothetical protein